MNSLDAELAKLTALTQSPIPDMRDDLYAILNAISKLSGTTDEIIKQETELREPYRAKLNQLTTDRTKSITQQWEIVKDLVTQQENLSNHPKTALLWSLVLKRMQGHGYPAIVKEFQELAQLLKD